MLGGGEERLSITDIIKYETHEPLIATIERPGAERNVLAYILKNPDAIYDVATVLKEKDFNNSLNRLLYQCMLRLSEKGIAVSTQNILAVTRGNDVLDKQGEEYLHRISQTDVSGIDFDYNVQLVLVASLKRQAYTEGLYLLNDCVDENLSPDDADSFIGRQQQRFMQLGLQTGDRVMQIADGVDEWLEEKKANPTPVPGLKSGFDELDAEIGGFRPGRLYVFAARSKSRKSILLNNFAIHIAAKQKVPILYLDTEMDTKEDVRPRLLAILSGVSENRITTGMFAQSPSELEAVNKAKEVLKETPFYHCYIPNFSTTQIVSLVRKYYIKYKLGALFFDYIKMPLKQTDNLKEYQLLGLLTATLKDLVGELQIPCITACQLNREGANTEEINSTHIAGSDRILMNCSYLFYMWKKSPEDIAKDGIDAGNMVLKLGESRHGGTTGEYTAWLYAHPENARITEVIKL